MKRFQILACVTVAISTVASAQAAPKPIARADYIKVVDGRFNGADTNHDGQLTRAEVLGQQQRDLEKAKAQLNQRLTTEFSRLDTNRDGKLTLAEFLAGVPPVKTAESVDQMIARYDANHDGKISADEFRNPEVAKFNRVDANHDGIVTPQEQQAASKR